MLRPIGRGAEWRILAATFIQLPAVGTFFSAGRSTASRAAKCVANPNGERSTLAVGIAFAPIPHRITRFASCGQVVNDYLRARRAVKMAAAAMIECREPNGTIFRSAAWAQLSARKI